MYLIAPALNLFVDNVNRNRVRNTIMILALFQFLYSWMFNATWLLARGNSPTWFITLYLFARYANVYKTKISYLSKPVDFFWIFAAIFNNRYTVYNTNLPKCYFSNS